jgi:hypothetical protein
VIFSASPDHHSPRHTTGAGPPATDPPIVGSEGTTPVSMAIEYEEKMEKCGKYSGKNDG